MNKERYKKTVELLIEVLPYSLKDERVALKGGTAINLFHRNFPRFSVDIDLCYLPLENRDTTFKNLHGVLRELKDSLEKNLGLKVSSNNPLDGKKEVKLFATRSDVEIKIEPNFVLRSSLFPTVDIDLAANAVKEFEKTVNVRCLNLADTYGGKICAALDRQHPRDLYDVKYLLENEGITTDVKDSFIFYLISHNRPINELLNPNFKDITREYREEFVDMAKNEVTLDELLINREKLIKSLRSSFTAKDKEFLISFVSNAPNWDLVRDKKVQEYPSVRWKLHNQSQMREGKRDIYVEEVKRLFIE
ncbi:MAG: nucleotidyl transferase AbiEii/AbiGii toxin family protein [Bacteriovoracaceae bacterium]